MRTICTITLLLLIGLPAAFSQDERELAHFRTFFEKAQVTSVDQEVEKAETALKQAREIGDGSEEAKALRHLGLIYLTRVPAYEDAMKAFIRELSLEDSLQLDDRKILTYVAIAEVFRTVGDYVKSGEFLEQAIQTAPERQHINTQAFIRLRLGNILVHRGDVEEALEIYKRVLLNRRDIDKNLEAEAQFRIGHLHMVKGDYEEALRRYKDALAIARSLRDRRLEAQYLNDIGILYSLMKNPEKSLANHQVALDIRRQLGDAGGLAESHNNLGAWYHQQGQPEKALEHGLLGLEKAREAQDQDQIFRSCELLSQAYRALGDFRNALDYKHESLNMYEFMQGEREERRLAEAQTRYIVAQKEAEIQKLDELRQAREREIAEQRRFRNTLFLVVILILVITGLLFILYLVKHRANRTLRASQRAIEERNIQLQQLNSTKDKFFSIIGHDLKGPLNSLTSFSHLLINHTDQMSKDEIRMLASDLDKSVRNLFALLENLLQWARSQTGNIDYTPEVFSLNAVLEENRNLLEAQAQQKDIRIELDAPEPTTVKLHKASINTVVRNLLSNAIKFTPEGGMIRAGIRRSSDAVAFYVSDNGVGISQEAIARLFRVDSKISTKGTAGEKGTGLGLILCADFVRRNGGQISVTSEPGKGSVFSCVFPISILAPKPIAESSITTA